MSAESGWEGSKRPGSLSIYTHTKRDVVQGRCLLLISVMESTNTSCCSSSLFKVYQQKAVLWLCFPLSWEYLMLSLQPDQKSQTCTHTHSIAPLALFSLSCLFTVSNKSHLICIILYVFAQYIQVQLQAKQIVGSGNQIIKHVLRAELNISVLSHSPISRLA